jgi:phosphohistidine phosphatase
MKTIHLIRHAKSSWDDPRLSDDQRPLSPRGRKDCRLMAPALAGLGWHGQAVKCSRATRARQTIAGISDAFPAGELDWQVDPQLYTFSSTEILSWLRVLDDTLNEVTLVGHNPAFTDVVDQLAETSFHHLPTCAYVRLDAAVPDWSSLRTGCARLRHFLKPKMLK